VPDVIIYNIHLQDSQPNVTMVDANRIDVAPTQAIVPEQDEINIIDDDVNEFTDDEDSFILMTPAAMRSQQIASQTQGSLVSFQKSMMNMLDDRLPKV
jgi:hypothetical protein